MRGIAEEVSYVLVEFCCSKDSRLSCDRYSRHDGKVVLRIRLTEEHDMTSQAGLRWALAEVEPFLGKVPVFLWGSLLCTLGSPWQKLNYKRPGWGAREEFLTNQFTALHASFMEIAMHIKSHPMGEICYEWPSRCLLWREFRVIAMVDKFKFEMTSINGCVLGLKSSKGNPIKKPWNLGASFKELAKMFAKNCKCDKSHVRDTAAGNETAQTSFYPQLMCDKVHKAFGKYAMYHRSDPRWNGKVLGWEKDVVAEQDTLDLKDQGSLVKPVLKPIDIVDMC